MVRVRNVARRLQVELDEESAPVSGEELPALRGRGLLRRHDLPPRDPGIHDPGRRLHGRHEAQGGARADQERGRQRPAQPARHARDGAHQRPAQRDRRSSSSISWTTTSSTTSTGNFGYAVFGRVTAGHGRHRQDREGEDRPTRRPRRRAGRGGRHQVRPARRRRLTAACRDESPLPGRRGSLRGGGDRAPVAGDAEHRRRRSPSAGCRCRSTAFMIRGALRHAPGRAARAGTTGCRGSAISATRRRRGDRGRGPEVPRARRLRLRGDREGDDGRASAAGGSAARARSASRSRRTCSCGRPELGSARASRSGSPSGSRRSGRSSGSSRFTSTAPSSAAATWGVEAASRRLLRQAGRAAHPPRGGAARRGAAEPEPLLRVANPSAVRAPAPGVDPRARCTA